MFDFDRWKEIWETISRNRKRSIMTGLGVFWGVFLFTILMGVGTWMDRTVTASMSGYSKNTAYFFTGQTSIPYKGMSAWRWWNFDTDDIESIKKQVPEVKYISAQNWGGSQKLSYGQRKGNYYLIGYTPEYQKINTQELRFGRFINEWDMAEKRKVCVIGEQIWNELFPGGEDPVGATINMNGLYLKVIGVIQKGNNFITINSNPAVTIGIPNTLLQQLRKNGKVVDMIAVTAQDDVQIKDVEDKCKRILMTNHIISPDDKKALNSFNLGEMFQQENNLVRGIRLLIWIVGLGTLLAGIVGVSNIMLVTVRERTQEIGVRRAIGAKPWSIVSQILSESLTLTFISGILGFAAGVGLLSLSEGIINSMNLRFMGNWIQPIQISFDIGLVSVFIIICGSLLAGIIPALRAIRINPVDAIREE